MARRLDVRYSALRFSFGNRCDAGLGRIRAKRAGGGGMTRQAQSGFGLCGLD